METMYQKQPIRSAIGQFVKRERERSKIINSCEDANTSKMISKRKHEMHDLTVHDRARSSSVYHLNMAKYGEARRTTKKELIRNNLLQIRYTFIVRRNAELST